MSDFALRSRLLCGACDTNSPCEKYCISRIFHTNILFSDSIIFYSAAPPSHLLWKLQAFFHSVIYSLGNPLPVFLFSKIIHIRLIRHIPGLDDRNRHLGMMHQIQMIPLYFLAPFSPCQTAYIFQDILREIFT